MLKKLLKKIIFADNSLESQRIQLVSVCYLFENGKWTDAKNLKIEEIYGNAEKLFASYSEKIIIMRIFLLLLI